MPPKTPAKTPAKSGKTRPKARLVTRFSPNFTRGLDGYLAYNLRRAQEASFAAFSKRVGDTHIWPGWYALLKIIHDNPRINQTELSHASGRDKSTLTISLRQLSKEGLVVRERDADDRRSLRLSLTAQGADHLQQLDVHAHAHDERVDQIVGAENRETMLEILRDLAEQLDRF